MDSARNGLPGGGWSGFSAMGAGCARNGLPSATATPTTGPAAAGASARNGFSSPSSLLAAHPMVLALRSAHPLTRASISA